MKYLVLMAYAKSGIAKAIVQYDWTLENVDEEPQTFASKIISFRGEKVFRVGLKNHVTSPVLFFMAIDLKKIGMKIEGVTYGIKDSGIGPETMWQMVKENIGDDNQVSQRISLSMDPEDGSLQLFTVKLEKQVSGSSTFVFRICLGGSESGYSYQLSDRLAKDQLWAAVIQNKNWVDVEIVAKGKTFSAHKAVLAARSPIFAAKFTKEKQQGNDQLVRIHIDDVEPSTVEQFLRFIYTGESMGIFANEKLLKLAEQFQLTTLTSLCRTALEKIKPIQMMKLATNLNMEANVLSTKIRYKY